MPHEQAANFARRKWHAIATDAVLKATTYSCPASAQSIDALASQCVVLNACQMLL